VAAKAGEIGIIAKQRQWQKAKMANKASRNIAASALKSKTNGSVESGWRHRRNVGISAAMAALGVAASSIISGMAGVSAWRLIAAARKRSNKNENIYGNGSRKMKNHLRRHMK